MWNPFKRRQMIPPVTAELVTQETRLPDDWIHPMDRPLEKQPSLTHHELAEIDHADAVVKHWAAIAKARGE